MNRYFAAGVGYVCFVIGMATEKVGEYSVPVKYEWYSPFIIGWAMAVLFVLGWLAHKSSTKGE